MKILVACEESQVVTAAFRMKGHEAYSCDIQECSGGHPEWHIVGDVEKVLSMDWDMIIAFPPCTYLANSGSCRLVVNGNIDRDRYEKAMLGKEFFMKFYNHPCGKICIENPVPNKRFELPRPSQYIEPFYFGHNFSKRTYLWLKGLPPLFPTAIETKYTSWVLTTSLSKTRSKTFPGVAAAMAEQWG